jgi:hypothetical protein
MGKVHPEAAKRAEELIQIAARGVSDAAPEPRPLFSTYSPPLPIAGTFGPGDIRGPLVGSHTDRFGRDVELHYADSERMISLAGEPLAQFQAAVRTLHQQSGIRSSASEATISKLAFEWLCRTHIEGQRESLVAYVESELEKLINDVTVILPIFGLHVEGALQVGHVTFEDITPAESAGWRAMNCRMAPDHINEANALHDALDKKVLGRAAARVTMRAEPDYAVDWATEQAEVSLALLRLTSIGAFAPEAPTTFALAGRENVARGIDIILGPGDKFSTSEYILHSNEMQPAVFDQAFKASHVTPIVGHWSALLTKEQLTPLESGALRSALTYSRATRYRNISEKLIHIFAAVESLLLRNDNEPISSAISERLAFAVGSDLPKRLEIARLVKDVYALRSKFVHHAVEASPDAATLKKLEEFLAVIAGFYINMKGAMAGLNTPVEFIDALERRKFS